MGDALVADVAIGSSGGAAPSGAGTNGFDNYFNQAIAGMQQAQEAQLAFQQQSNELKAKFQARSSLLQVQDSMSTKMAAVMQQQAQAMAR